MADFYINALTFNLATAVYVDIALSTKAPDGFYSVDNVYRQQVGGLLLSGTTTCDDPIQANNDSYSSVVTVGMNGNNILANDTVNGVPATTGNVQIAQVSSTNANVNINTSNGAVVVGTVTPVGTYTIVYRICQLSNITNCSTANITVTVTPLTIYNCFEYGSTCTEACYGETPPPAFRSWHFSSPGRADSSLACADDETYPNIFYSADQVGNVPAMGTIMYTNSNLTGPVAGGNLWFNLQEATIEDPTAYQIAGNGELVDFDICDPAIGTCQRLNVTISEADVLASDNSTVTMTYTDCSGNPFATYGFNDGGTFLVDLCVADGSSFAFSYLLGGSAQNSGASGAIIQGPCPEPGNNVAFNDCANGLPYNAVNIGGYTIGDTVEYRVGGVGSVRCGTIYSDTHPSGSEDAVLTGLQRDCGDDIHCDLS